MPDLSTCSILVVDDTEEIIDILVEYLGSSYNVMVAMDGENALEIISSEKPDLILLDILMPGLDGYTVCKRIKDNPETRDIPVIFLTSLSDAQDEKMGLQLGAIDYIAKPLNQALVQARVKNQLELKMHRDHLETLVHQRTAELELTQEVTIESMGTLAEYRDPETGGHIKRTKYYMKALAEHLKSKPEFSAYLSEEIIKKLTISAPLHDIGKVGVPDHILLKPGKLTEEEFETMKLHTIYGRDTIKKSEQKLGTKSFLHQALEIAEHHHEKWDGTGYPNKLKGKEIPLPGRLMALADVYDALISHRVYKKPFTHTKASAIIKEGRGKHFDPAIVDAFMEISEEFRQIALKNADFEEERQALLH